MLLLSIATVQGRDGTVLAQQKGKLNHQPQLQFAFQKASSFVDETNFMHVYGELKNLSNKAMKNVVVTASLYDSKGKLLNQFRRSSELRTLNPGDVSPFEILYLDTQTVNAVTNYTLSATGPQPAMPARALPLMS